MDSSNSTGTRTSKVRIITIHLLTLFAVYISYNNFLLFHISIESFGITIIAAMLIIAMNTYHVSKNHYFMFLAIAFGFIGLFTFAHTLTYKGMAIFPDISANIPTQLYIITKYMTTISLVFSFRYLQRKLSIRKVVIVYSLISVGLFLSVFYWGNFPDCFIEGYGLSPFKIISEYVNVVILFVAMGLLLKYKASFHPKVFKDLLFSMVAGILASLAFTLYTDVYGFSNMLGHISQLTVFYFIFRGLVETCLKNPYEFLYFNLSQANGDLQKMNGQLIDYTVRIEAQQEELGTAYKKIQEGIDKAKKIHESFLPKALPRVKGISSEYYYKPASDLGGDFLNVQQIDDKLLIYIVDVSGHGLDGAILNIFIRENINKYLLTCQRENREVLPKDILSFLISQYAKEEFPDEYYICMLVGILDTKTNNFIYSNAGMHITPFVVNDKGELTRLDSPGLPIIAGFNFHLFPYTDQSIDLTEKFTILLTTDGLVEEMNEGKMYGEERLIKILLDNSQKSAKEIVQTIKMDFLGFLGKGQSKDDITYLVIKGSGKG
ncbi:MAG: hypothetical protein JM58_05060 [Peptococcaceae bacterium BICA1-8]|nr:MAG: hypothetical protein JM58_05060 [Peptococcaceae bacterium BICA1-8]